MKLKDVEKMFRIYLDYCPNICYVRFAPLETKMFPHGISLGTTFEFQTKKEEKIAKEKAENFKKEVSKYFYNVIKDLK